MERTCRGAKQRVQNWRLELTKSGEVSREDHRRCKVQDKDGRAKKWFGKTINCPIWTGLLFLILPVMVLADSQWNLTSSTLTYQASHPFHHVEGISHAARGKGQCQTGKCEFLIATPVKSFDSGDSNRDLHMLQVTRGGQFPMVVVRTEFPGNDIQNGTIHVDLEVQFAGQTVHYKQVPFQLKVEGNKVHLTGTIPATLTDFKIDAPSLLTIPIKNDIPVVVDMTWQKG